jgi:hypothetical protein
MKFSSETDSKAWNRINTSFSDFVLILFPFQQQKKSAYEMTLLFVVSPAIFVNHVTDFQKICYSMLRYGFATGAHPKLVRFIILCQVTAIRRTREFALGGGGGGTVRIGSRNEVRKYVFTNT